MLERDQRFISPSYTRSYPLVVARGYGAMLEDVDGNVFLDFNAGVAVALHSTCSAIGLAWLSVFPSLLVTPSL